MNPHDDETLMRHVDGELDAAAAARLEADALADPALASRLAALRGLGAAAREAFPAASDPRDAALAGRIAAAGAPRPARWAGVAGLLAASFVAGVVAAPLARGPGDGLVVAPGGRLADRGLVRVLDRRLAQEGSDRRGRAVGLTFRDADGRWCRTFVAQDSGVAGLACREDGAWAMQVLAPAAPVADEVRTAASATPAAVLAAVDARLAGETLDDAAEARARDRGWK